jgi:hypothetical protein
LVLTTTKFDAFNDYVVKTLLARKEYLEQIQNNRVPTANFFAKVLAESHAVSSKFTNTCLLMLNYCIAQPGRGAD